MTARTPQLRALDDAMGRATADYVAARLSGDTARIIRARENEQTALRALLAALGVQS